MQACHQGPLVTSAPVEPLPPLWPLKGCVSLLFILLGAGGGSSNEGRDLACDSALCSA